MASDRLAIRAPIRPSAASSYRKGSSGEAVGEGPLPPTHSHPVASREAAGGSSCYDEPGQANSGSGRRFVEHFPEEDAGGSVSSATRLSAVAAAEDLHTEEKRST